MCQSCAVRQWDMFVYLTKKIGFPFNDVLLQNIIIWDFKHIQDFQFSNFLVYFDQLT